MTEKKIDPSRLSEKQLRQLTMHYFNSHQAEIYKQTDQMFVWILLAQWIFEIVIALIVSPRSWYGGMSKVHIHVWTALILGGVINLFPSFLAWKQKGEIVTRYVIAIAQMSNSALLIHLTGGRIETHFHVFGSLAILAFYRDWRVLIPASITVLVDHALRGIYWPQSVYGVLFASPWRSIEHAAWVIFEDTFLILAALKSKQEMLEMAEKRSRLEMVNREIETIVRERTLRLQENEGRFRAISEASPFGLFVADVDGDCIYANAAYEKISNLTQKDLLMQGWIRAIHPEDRDRVVDEWQRAIKRQPFLYESVYRFFGNGNIHWAKVKAVPMISGDRLMGYVGIVDDISDQKLSERKEQKLLDEARQLTDLAQKKTFDLERFQQIAVGRELEMIDLKKEVNKLLKELQREQKYNIPGEKREK